MSLGKVCQGLLVLVIAGFGIHSYSQEATPISAKYQGSLTPVRSIEENISGRTVAFTLPAVTATRYEMRSAVVFFGVNGRADTAFNLGSKWRADGPKVCVAMDFGDDCYVALTDERGFAYLRHEKTGLLARVQELADGDKYRMKTVYAERQKSIAEARRREAEMSAAILGLVASMMFGGGFGGGDEGGGSSDICSTNPQHYSCNQNKYESRDAGYSRPDTSVGCTWGDRSYGTCVR